MPWASAAAACAAIVGSACGGSGSIPARKAQTSQVLPQSCHGCGAPRESSTSGICAWCRLDWLAFSASSIADRYDNNDPQTSKVLYGFATSKPELHARIGYDPRGGLPVQLGGGFLLRHGSDTRESGGQQLQVGRTPFRPSLSGRGSNKQFQRGFASCRQWRQGCARWLERCWSACLRAIS